MLNTGSRSPGSNLKTAGKGRGVGGVEPFQPESHTHLHGLEMTLVGLWKLSLALEDGGHRIVRKTRRGPASRFLFLKCIFILLT